MNTPVKTLNEYRLIIFRDDLSSSVRIVNLQHGIFVFEIAKRGDLNSEDLCAISEAVKKLARNAP